MKFRLSTPLFHLPAAGSNEYICVDFSDTFYKFCPMVPADMLWKAFLAGPTFKWIKTGMNYSLFFNN